MTDSMMDGWMMNRERTEIKDRMMDEWTDGWTDEQVDRYRKDGSMDNR